VRELLVLAHLLLEPAAQPGGGEREHLVAQVAPAALGERALGLDVRAVLVEPGDELLDAGAARRLGLDDRHAPAALRREAEHAADLAHHRVGQRMVGLVDDDDVGDLHHARLERLDGIARAGHQHQHDGVGVVDDVDLRLADADRLEEHVVAPRRVHQQRRLQRRLAQAAERAAVGHRADEHAGVEEVLGQADAVAENRALRERRRGVDRQHGDLAVLRAPELRERPDQRGLAGARRAGQADDRGAARLRIDLADDRVALGILVLHERDRTGQRAAVAVEQALGEGAVVGHGRGIMPVRLAASWSPRSLSRRGARPRVRSSAASRRPATAGRSCCCASCARTGCSTASTAGCSCGWRGSSCAGAGGW
jgi:hypothetical protein